jgi:hypothetical protein
VSGVIFRGEILSIDCAPIGIHGAFLDWIVRTKVIELISGTFTETHFAFRVHSPSRSGLEVGCTYTIEAKEVEGGFAVDENQWCR